MDDRVDLGRIAEFLSDHNSDVIVLNEVQDLWFGRRFDQGALLAGALGMELVWCPAIRIGPYRFGNVLLTRHKVLASRCVRLGWWRGLEPRSAVMARVAPDGGEPIWVVGTHLDVRAPARARQAARLAELVAGLDGPAILAGDLNAGAEAPELQPLVAWARADGAEAALPDDSPQPDEPMLTFPSRAPTQQRDHILAGPGCAIIRARTHAVQFSDHLPIVAAVSHQGAAFDDRRSSPSA
jgi:endonuclease/exonuclease/phosphatase family metal-dependent hydrolase